MSDDPGEPSSPRDDLVLPPVESETQSSASPPSSSVTNNNDKTSDNINDKISDKSNNTAISAKASKKDRHAQVVRALSLFLERTNDAASQAALSLSRSLRESLESRDAALDAFLSRIAKEDYLLDKSERHLLVKLDTLRTMISEREKAILSLSVDLDAVELSRAERVRAELTARVDELVAIGFSLRDDIERLIEREALDFNSEIVLSRKEHAQAVAVLHIQHVQREHSLVTRWEEVRTHWRTLRHTAAIARFEREIESDAFLHPTDRTDYMRSYRNEQDRRRSANLSPAIQRVLALSLDSLSLDAVAEIETLFQRGNEEEIQAIQRCYDTLTALRERQREKERERVEALRKELHLYGALCVSPSLPRTAVALRAALADDAFAELWRLGGGLKAEIAFLATQCESEDMVYDRVVATMKERLSLVQSGFSLRAVLEERGRGAALDKLRALVAKLRSAPRDEARAVVLALQSEIEELLSRCEAALPVACAASLSATAREMRDELSAVEKREREREKALSSGMTLTLSATASGQTATNAINTISVNNATNAGTGSKTRTTSKVTVSLSQSKQRDRERDREREPGNSLTAVSPHTAPVWSHMDPLLLKTWHRSLALLCYSSDLSAEVQSLLNYLEEQLERQRESNALVDAVVEERSAAVLRRMERSQRRLVERITTCLEANANHLNTQTSNITRFLRSLAHCVESHKRAQREIDERAADELFELREDSRLALEELEDRYAANCRAIRQATSQAEIDRYFSDVLYVLDGISSQYRAFHSDACFAADKHPLSLLGEFRECFFSLCVSLFLFPKREHPIEREYEAMYARTVRFNAKYFDKSESERETERENGKNALAVTHVIFDELHAVMLVTREERGFDNSSLVATPSSPSSLSLAEYVSPLGEGEPEALGGFGGRCDELDAMNTVCAYFARDGTFRDKRERESESESENEPQSNSNDSEEKEHKPTENRQESGEKASVSASAKEGADGAPAAHPQCAFLRADTASAVLPLPASEEAFYAMHEDDREDYEDALIRAFICLPEGPAPVAIETAPGAPAKKGKGAAPAPDLTGTVLALSDEAQQQYRLCEKLVSAAKERVSQRSTPQWARENVPQDERENVPWVRETCVREDELNEMVLSLRAALLAAIERESFKKTLTVRGESERAKAALTDELEERLRAHWPRRGRVETETKQPREAELLSHRDKTYRLVQMIQSKMIALQDKFERLMDKSEEGCVKYEREMEEMTSLLGGEFRNLAALQAIDVRARGLTLDFQSSSSHNVESLTQHATVDVDAVAAFARDFRRVCPAQSESEPGGYSESEINEIQTLVNAQCVEMASLTAQWTERVSALSTRLSLTTHSAYETEFLSLYARAVQQVSLAEGLGPRYGAPRRTAQQRLRDALALDEKKAGKVDELLAELEFFKSEVLRLPLSDALSLSVSVSVSPTTSSERDRETESGESEKGETEKDPLGGPLVASCSTLNKLHFAWCAVRVLRDALAQRVAFLSVRVERETERETERDAAGNAFVLNEDGDKNALFDFPYINTTRLLNTVLFPLSVPSPFAVDDDKVSQKVSQSPRNSADSPTLFAVVDGVEASCRAETLSLYESEGLKGEIPLSLEQWLRSARERVLGRGGVRERAWKRLFAQLARLDALFVRERPRDALREGERETEREGEPAVTEQEAGETKNAFVKTKSTFSKVKALPPSKNAIIATTATAPQSERETERETQSVQGAALQSYLFVYVLLAKTEYFEQKRRFGRLVKVWALSREKHERALRPRLGSPDRASELAALDERERARAEELRNSVKQFRSAVVRSQIEKFLYFAEDIAQFTKGWLRLLDSVVRQELVSVPPDTECPTRHKTLKKLRKAQRARERERDGESERQREREWPGLAISAEMTRIVRENEDLVIDLGGDTESAPQTTEKTTAKKEKESKENAKKSGGKDGKDAKKGEKNKGNPADIKAANAATAAPSLLPEAWLRRVESESACVALVSVAHRVALRERDAALQSYFSYLNAFLVEVREESNALLLQEESWAERWARQVEMLRSGNV